MTVIFWYGSGYADGPATVVVQAKHDMRRFDLGAAAMCFGVNTDFGGAPLRVAAGWSSVRAATDRAPIFARLVVGRPFLIAAYGVNML